MKIEDILLPGEQILLKGKDFLHNYCLTTDRIISYHSSGAEFSFCCYDGADASISLKYGTKSVIVKTAGNQLTLEFTNAKDHPAADELFVLLSKCITAAHRGERYIPSLGKQI